MDIYLSQAYKHKVLCNIYIYIYVCVCVCVLNHLIGLVVECSPMGQDTGVQSQVESYQRLKNCSTLPYKVRFKGKVEQSRERSSTFSYTLV